MNGYEIIVSPTQFACVLIVCCTETVFLSFIFIDNVVQVHNIAPETLIFSASTPAGLLDTQEFPFLVHHGPSSVADVASVLADQAHAEQPLGLHADLDVVYTEESYGRAMLREIRRQAQVASDLRTPILCSACMAWLWRYLIGSHCMQPN